MAFTFSDCQDLSSISCHFESTASGFTLFHTNIRSVRKYWDQFCIVANSLKNPADVWVLTEVNVPSISVDQFSLPGYREFFRTRSGRTGGGIAVFVKESWVTELLNVTFAHAECVALKISNSLYSVTLLAVYRPPSDSVTSFLDELRSSLADFNVAEQLCVLGDINIDTLKPAKTTVCDYLNILSEFGLDCTIQAPTREEFFNGHFVSACLDHINVRAYGLQVKSAVISQKLADHYFTAVQLVSNTPPKNAGPETRQIEVVDRILFDKLISGYEWDILMRSSCQEEIYSKFIHIWQNITGLSKRVVTVKKRHAEHLWLSNDIIAAIKYKELLWMRCRRSPDNVDLQIKFKSERNRVTALIRSAKRNYVKQKLVDARSDSRVTWSVVNELRGEHKAKHSVDETIAKYFPG